MKLKVVENIFGNARKINKVTVSFFLDH